ncbi:MAG: hypothetical protein Q8O84_00455 [Nanoarchaeota archaeon]|nr:hypothetical protein [Nanoarchaeota archaeon]
MVVKKSLIIFSIAIFLISMSFVSAIEITGDVQRATSTTDIRLEVNDGSSDAVSGTSTLTTGTRTTAETSPIRRSLSRFSRVSSPGIDWSPVLAIDGTTCYIQKSPTSRFGLFERTR